LNWQLKNWRHQQLALQASILSTVELASEDVHFVRKGHGLGLAKPNVVNVLRDNMLSTTCRAKIAPPDSIRKICGTHAKLAMLDKFPK
jgi:hypothetical protein